MDLVRHGRPTAAGILSVAGAVTGNAVGQVERKSGVQVSGSAARGAVRADLDEVFRRDYQLVVGVAARVLGSRDQAEDVAQDVFLSFCRAVVPAGEARGWLSVAAAHTALNLLRSGRRRASREETAAATDDTVVPDVAEAVVTLEDRGRVRAALARLPRKQAVARAAAQRPELRRRRRGARHVPRQRRHDRATRRVRPSQGVEPSCVIRLRACCAG
jgi:DNA-directed RNA polymerase specialized sigma24 family protein